MGPTVVEGQRGGGAWSVIGGDTYSGGLSATVGFGVYRSWCPVRSQVHPCLGVETAAGRDVVPCRAQLVPLVGGLWGKTRSYVAALN